LALAANPNIDFQDDPAYKLFERISRVNKYMLKEAYNQKTTWLMATKRVSDDDFYAASYQAIIDAEVKSNKNPQTINAFKQWKNPSSKDGIFKTAIAKISKAFSNTFEQSIYDRDTFDLYHEMGLELSEKNQPLNNDWNLDKIIEADPILNACLKINTFSTTLTVHRGVIENMPLSTSPIPYKDQIRLALDNEYDETQKWVEIKCESYFWTVIGHYIKNQYGLERSPETLENRICKKLIELASPNKELFVNPVYSTLADRHKEWLQAGRPSMMENWLPLGLHVNKAENPRLYRKLQIVGKKIVQAHIARALCQNEGGVSCEYMVITCGKNEGTGKSTFGRVPLAGMFGYELGTDKDKLFEEDCLKYGASSSLNIFESSENKTREGFEVRGLLIANIDEVDQYLSGKRDWAKVKGLISKTHFSGVPIFGKTKLNVPYRFVIYGSSNTQTLLQKQQATHRRFLIIDLDYVNETNQDEYAIKLVSKESKDKTPKAFTVNHNGNGLDKGCLKKESGYSIDITTLSQNIALAYGEAFEKQTLGQWDEDELNRLKDTNRVELIKEILPNGRNSEKRIYVEKLNLTSDEKEIIGDSNRAYQVESETTQGDIIEAVKNYDSRILSPAILDGDSFKNLNKYERENLYKSIITTLTTEGIAVDEKTTLKIDKRKIKISESDAQTKKLNLVKGQQTRQEYVFYYETRNADGTLTETLVASGQKPFKNKETSLSDLDVLENL